MKTISMCFSLLQVPRIRVDSWSGLWCRSFGSSSQRLKNHNGSRLLSSTAHGSEGGSIKQFIKKPVTSQSDARNRKAESSERQEPSNRMVSASTELNRNISETSEFPGLRDHDNQHTVDINRDLASLVTVIIFDIETTGFSRENDRIIEIALQDLAGGENSTFQTLVNPECKVMNSHVHGIKTRMVNRTDVPRMKDLVPILLQYVKSRQKPGGHVLWVAHNARAFDVPFLRSEFSRCSTEFPPNWRFVDTIPLVRELIKSTGSEVPSGKSLQSLCGYYKIKLTGSAHRAMSDVHALSLILQRLTFDLKVTVLGLLERSFGASDLNSSKIKKKKKSMG